MFTFLALDEAAYRRGHLGSVKSKVLAWNVRFCLHYSFNEDHISWECALWCAHSWQISCCNREGLSVRSSSNRSSKCRVRRLRKKWIVAGGKMLRAEFIGGVSLNSPSIIKLKVWFLSTYCADNCSIALHRFMYWKFTDFNQVDDRRTLKMTEVKEFGCKMQH